MKTLLWTIMMFGFGSLMFSYWIGRALRKNITKVGDGNPGGWNLWQSAGVGAGLAGIALDFLKGYLPLAVLLNNGEVSHYGMVFAASAPVAGHAFSPFLKGRGGKAIAVTFGVWSALTRFEVSTTLAVILALLLVAMMIVNKGRAPTSAENGMQVLAGMLLAAVYLVLRRFDGLLLWVWLIHFLLLVYTHKFAWLPFVNRKTDHGAKG